MGPWKTHKGDVMDRDRQTEVVWRSDVGVGICQRAPDPDLYGKLYWEEYRRRDRTQMGADLTAARIAFVRRFVPWWELMVDVGVGGGRFVEETGASGYDVNPFAIDWLKQRDRWHDIHTQPADVFTMFDVVEHSRDWSCLRHCLHFAFVSTPIYLDEADARASRHFKPARGEHVLYLTNNGLKWFMRQHGFEMVAYDNFETRLGRDAIGTYAFRRIKKGPE